MYVVKCREGTQSGPVNEYGEKIPKSQHITGDACVFVVKTVITHSSPCSAVGEVDLETSSIRKTVVTSEFHLH